MSAYRAAYVAGVRRGIGAPGELVVRLLFYALILVVFAALWEAAVKGRGGVIEGYDYPAIMWYVAIAEATVLATRPRMIEDIGNDISSGEIAVEMLRPVSVVTFRIWAELGEATVRLVGAVGIGVLLATLYAGAAPDAGALALALPSAMLGVACNLSAQHAFAASAFWLEDAKGAWFLYQKLVFLLGGMLLPLELFPDWLANASRLLPFQAMAYAPARLASAHLEPHLIVIQMGWLVAMFGLAAYVFGYGERRLQVAGG